MYVTGPAIGPVGRGHVHKVPCCAPCGRGGTCDSHKPLGATPERGWFLIGGLALMAYMLLGGPRRNPGKRRK